MQTVVIGKIEPGCQMTNFSNCCCAAILGLFSSLALAQEETPNAQLQPVMAVDLVGKPFPGGLRFSADGSTLWTERFQAWSVPDGKLEGPYPDERLKDDRLIIDQVANEHPMLVANRKSGALYFWEQDKGLRQRILKQSGDLAAARFIDQGKRFVLVFSKPPTIYFGDVDSDSNDSAVPLPIEAWAGAISHDGALVAIRNNRDITIWDVKAGGIRTKLDHEHRPFALAFSQDSQWIATGALGDNTVRLFDTSKGTLAGELEAHTKGKIFLPTGVYSLAFATNGKWLASGGHDGRVVLWDWKNRKALAQTRLKGPPIVRSLAFSTDSSLIAASFLNTQSRHPVRVWKISGDTSNGSDD